MPQFHNFLLDKAVFVYQYYVGASTVLLPEVVSCLFGCHKNYLTFVSTRRSYVYVYHFLCSLCKCVISNGSCRKSTFVSHHMLLHPLFILPQPFITYMFPSVSCSLCFSFHFVNLEFIHIQRWPWCFDISHLHNGTIALPFFVTFPLKVLLYSCLSFCLYSSAVSSASSKYVSDWNVSVKFLCDYCVQLASRALHHQVTPLITMHLTLETKTAFASGSTSRKNVVLQTDPTNLVHVTQVLEEALRGSRSQHSRQIQRSFK